jgi:tRNA(Ile)-lysidine synthase
MYYGAVQTLSERVIHYIRHYQLATHAGDRVGVAVSGGVDSVALLRLFLELRAELGVVLSVVHFNHKLRGAESEEDEQFVGHLAAEHKLEFHCESGDVASYSASNRLSLETAAREMRYQFFKRLLLEGGLNRVATAHTLDDQAETVLLRIVRGAGTRGLAGIYPQLSVPSPQFSLSGSPESHRPRVCASIVRPLLAIRRKELEAYLASLGQSWREDSSNRDLRHARNRMRHGILPRLARNLNPRVHVALAELAEIARAEEEYWNAEVKRALPRIRREHVDVQLGVAELVKLPLALQRRVIRAAAQALNARLEFRHVEEILELLDKNSSRAVLPNSSTASIESGWLVFRTAPQLSSPVRDYEYRLPVPGKISIPETGMLFETSFICLPVKECYSPENLLSVNAVSGNLTLRNWRPGDRFWPAHAKAQKKVKELLHDKHLSLAERKLWPVVARGGEIVWVRGFPTPAHLEPRKGQKQALLIREVPLSARGNQ